VISSIWVFGSLSLKKGACYFSVLQDVNYYFFVGHGGIGSMTSSVSLFARRLKMSSWEMIFFMFSDWSVAITVASLPPKPSV